MSMESFYDRYSPADARGVHALKDGDGETERLRILEESVMGGIRSLRM